MRPCSALERCDKDQGQSDCGRHDRQFVARKKRFGASDHVAGVCLVVLCFGGHFVAHVHCVCSLRFRVMCLLSGQPLHEIMTVFEHGFGGRPEKTNNDAQVMFGCKCSRRAWRNRYMRSCMFFLQMFEKHINLTSGVC